jgi:hypothetical protein
MKKLGREKSCTFFSAWLVSIFGAKILLGQELKMESFEDYFELLHTFKFEEETSCQGGKSALEISFKTTPF